jgi:hypothetical protein
MVFEISLDAVCFSVYLDSSYLSSSYTAQFNGTQLFSSTALFVRKLNRIARSLFSKPYHTPVLGHVVLASRELFVWWKLQNRYDCHQQLSMMHFFVSCQPCPFFSKLLQCILYWMFFFVRFIDEIRTTLWPTLKQHARYMDTMYLFVVR